ncbi:MAG TPA: twin-arginine translocase TatA/TatE family subunit [Candidatus Nitrosocosmicus sp.]|nr:twin-arginine translocase TatA/TatE family subunit [Candidatus Nitrosocosmicus sp.]
MTIQNDIFLFVGLGGYEWVIIVAIILIIFFGAKKLPELARGIGKASSEFEKVRWEAKRELEMIKNPKTTSQRDQLEKIAYTLGIDFHDMKDDELKAAIDNEINKSKK